VLARFVATLPPAHRVMRWLPRIAIVLLVAIALVGLARALR